MKERKALRALLKTGQPFLMAGVFNPMSALIAQSAGFKAVHM
jgi:2-methylisocitrate lyase-like PEP mutase family enzyme